MKSIYAKQINWHMCLKKECIYEGSTLQYIFTNRWKTLEKKSHFKGTMVRLSDWNIDLMQKL